MIPDFRAELLGMFYIVVQSSCVILWWFQVAWNNIQSILDQIQSEE